MHPDQLTHTLTVRITPALRDELTVAAENLDCSVGELTRRSLRLGIDDADKQTMNPRAPLPSEEKVAIVSGSLKLPGGIYGRSVSAPASRFRRRGDGADRK